jgi:hypothetical protein
MEKSKLKMRLTYLGYTKSGRRRTEAAATVEKAVARPRKAKAATADRVS